MATWRRQSEGGSSHSVAALRLRSQLYAGATNNVKSWPKWPPQVADAGGVTFAANGAVNVATRRVAAAIDCVAHTHTRTHSQAWEFAQKTLTIYLHF